MDSSATAPNSLSFFSSSLFLSSSHQIPKTYISVSKFGSGKASKPLSVASQLATLPIISFEGEKVGEKVAVRTSSNFFSGSRGEDLAAEGGDSEINSPVASVKLMCSEMDRRTRHWNWNDFSIGIEGEVFSFSHCYNKVTVAEASGLTGETVQIQDFIREYIKPLAQTCINRLNVRLDSYAFGL
ncbi:unnamed protein product [Arabidopsis lyrata]|nr:unnamed protein product [Arabidopsis lyrata]